jgi:glycosyltransferase involved in cell wall biosynthesis
VRELGLDPGKVHVIHHGAFEHLARLPSTPLVSELEQVTGPVVLFFGLLRPYKGLDVLLEAWRDVPAGGAELWIVGRPRMDIAPLLASAPPGVRFVSRYVPDTELASYFRRADVVVLPYSRTDRFDQSGVLATALAFAKPVVLSDVGGFGEVAATGAGVLVQPGDVGSLSAALRRVLGDAGERSRLAEAARAAAAGPYSWDEAARRTLDVYRGLTSAREAAAPQSAPS